jgi:hypothetical protein
MAAKTTQTPKAAPTTPEPLFINFAAHEGSAPRRMLARIPSPEQLAVWQNIGETFTRLGDEWRHQSAAVANLPTDHPRAVAVRSTQNRQAVRGIGRSVKLIKSVLVDEVDHEWVDDMIMEGVTIEKMLGIVTEAVNELSRRAEANGRKPSTGTPKGKAALSE